MAVGGYKRIALAALAARKRSNDQKKEQQSKRKNANHSKANPDPGHKISTPRKSPAHKADQQSTTRAARKRPKEQDKKQQVKQTSLDRSNTNSEPDRELSTPNKVPADTVEQPSVSTLRKREKQRLKELHQWDAVKEQLQVSEGWNAEKQRQKQAEKDRQRKLEKQSRKRARKKQLRAENQEKLMRANGESAGAHRDTTLETETHASPNQTVTLREYEKEDDRGFSKETKFEGCNPDMLQDPFLDVPSVEEPQQLTQLRGSMLDGDESYQIPFPPHQNRPNNHRPRTPTHSPQTDHPMTPNHPIRTPDVLMITPRRQASPQLEFIVSPSSSTLLRSAANILLKLKTHTKQLNTQIAVFSAHLVAAQKERIWQIASGKPDHSATKVKAMENIVEASEKHSNEVFMLECALRDVVGEGGEDLSSILKRTEEEFGESVKVHERKLRKLAKKFDPEAAEKAVQEMK